MIRKQNFENNAFTLIELLVVIAIIGILSSVVLASLSNSRASARDTKRAQDFRQLRTAVNQYYNDNGQWPGEGSSNDQVSEQCTSVDIYTDLVPEYLPEIPTDPSENVKNCDVISDTSYTDDNDFYYGWDNVTAGDKEACFGINNFESTDDAGNIENLDQGDNYQGGGGSGSLNQNYMDFIYCFEPGD